MIELAQNALTTLERFAAMTGLPIADDATADRLTLLINQASAQVETLIDRKLRKQTYTDNVTATGRQELLLREYPIVAVESVTHRCHELDPSEYDYSMTGAAGILYRDDGWTYDGYPYGLAGDPIAGKRNVVVRYTAGFVLPKDATPDDPITLPADLEGLIWEMVQSAYGKMTSGGNAGLRAFSVADVRWEWQNEMPTTWMQIIDAYRRVAL